jgi:hypothetical protein
MNVSLQELNKTGFIFHKYDQNLITQFNRDEMVFRFKNYIESLLSIAGENLYHDFDLIQTGQNIAPHYHLIPGSFQVVIWLPKIDFQGRYFIFGNPKCLSRAKPQAGYMCFMKPNDPNFIHGVTKLISPQPIETLGFSSLIKHLDGNKDIFVKSYKINNELCQLHDLI